MLLRRETIRRICIVAAIMGALVSCTTNRQAAPVHTEAYKDPVFTAFFRREAGWVAGDGALSIPLTDNRVMWLFGDSHIDDYDGITRTLPCLFQVRNAAMIHDKADLQNTITLVGKGPGFKSWFKNSADEKLWFWPLCGFQNEHAIYVYLASLRSTPAGGMWGFESTGRDQWGKMQFPEMAPVTYALLPDFNGIVFGVGFVKEAEYVYAFGGKQNGMVSDVYLARFAAANPE